MMKRICVPILALALLCLVSTPALAQDDVYCSELNEEDCELLYEAADASMEVLSSSSVANVNITAQNLPEVPYSDLAFDLVVETISSASEDTVAALEDLQMAIEEDDPEAFADVFGEMFSDIALDTSMDVSFSDDLVALIEEEGDIAWPENVLLNLRLVEGNGFLDFDALTESVPELAALLPVEFEGWIGAELGQFVVDALEEAEATGDATLESSMGSASLGSQSGGPLLTQLAPLDPTGETLEFLVVERGEDVTADGEDAATFVYTFDLSGFVSSDLYPTLIEAALVSQGETPSEQELAEIVGVSQLVAPLLASSLDLELVETIGIEDAYPYGSDFVLALDLTELVGIASSFGAIEPLDLEGDSVFSLTVSSSNFDINEEVDIEEPEDAGVYTSAQLIELIEVADSLQ